MKYGDASMYERGFWNGSDVMLELGKPRFEIGKHTLLRFPETAYRLSGEQAWWQGREGMHFPNPK